MKGGRRRSGRLKKIEEESQHMAVTVTDAMWSQERAEWGDRMDESGNN